MSLTPNNLPDGFYRQLCAEFAGTFMLVFAGCGAIIANDLFGGTVGHIGISMTFGLVVMTGIYAVGETSGAHFNPAVSLAFWMSGVFPLAQLLPYVVVQILAALTAALFLLALAPEHATLGTTQPASSLFGCFLLEVVLTWWLVTVILSVATGSKEKGLFAGIAVGGAVALGALFGGPFTGASMNPARSLGPALVSGELSALWLYLTAPCIGAMLAVFTCGHIHTDDCCATDPSEKA